MEQTTVRRPRLPRVKFPLVVKLIGIISGIVVVSMGLVSVLSWWLYSADAQARAEENNFAVSDVLASRVSAEIEAVDARALTLLDNLRPVGAESLRGADLVSAFFRRNASVAAVAVPGAVQLVNNRFFLANEIPVANAEAYLASLTVPLDRARAGETLMVNASPAFGVPMAALLVPFRDYGTANALVVVFSTEGLQAMVQTKSANLSFLVDDGGRVLVHPDSTLVKIGASFKDHPLVAELLKASTDNLQVRYTEPATGSSPAREAIGAFHKLSLGQVGVLSSIPADTVYAAALRITRQNTYLTGVVLVLSILAVWFFARSVTRPVLALVAAARRIEEGQFHLELTATTRDELGLLTKSFVHMGQGLAERERVKETFGKFVNKEIAELALQGNLALGGTRRVATIFFSDIRSFTAISETMEPEAVVEFLNAYMTRMVHCIEQTGGVVDKFIGDAIMAVWGAPVSQGSPELDALAAVRAMLLMRESLAEFNADRGGPGKPLIKIGCGLNTGPCLAGQIGSEQRMEYTVIGDAVNLASRIEALNKPFGTDILISQNTLDLVGHHFLTQPMAPIRVKGKAEPLQIYAVVGAAEGPGPRTLEELRTLLGIEAPSGTPNPDHEEKKYEVLD
jgi:adenylate cyclase